MNDRRPAGPVDGALEGALMAPPDALALAERRDTAALMAEAAGLRDAHHGAVMTYSRKVFIPLTHLCRDACHYCTFAMPPRRQHDAFIIPLHEGLWAYLPCQSHRVNRDAHSV